MTAATAMCPASGFGGDAVLGRRRDAEVRSAMRSINDGQAEALRCDHSPSQRSRRMVLRGLIRAPDRAGGGTRDPAPASRQRPHTKGPPAKLTRP